jgi:hypothetical protein
MAAHSRQVLLDLVRWNGQIDDLIVAARVIPEGELPSVVLASVFRLGWADLA